MLDTKVQKIEACGMCSFHFFQALQFKFLIFKVGIVSSILAHTGLRIQVPPWLGLETFRLMAVILEYIFLLLSPKQRTRRLAPQPV